MLAWDEKASGFIETPALRLAAEVMADAQSAAIIGRQFGVYTAVSLLGAGGMGEVYLAEDQRLGRRVALKLLPAPFTTDPERVRRFTQEARAASALNHPNILTIYEIGQAEQTHFIATEFIEGETLRARLLNGKLPLDETLDFAEQIAAALNAAHEAGIIHRDIKPENVMVRRDGYVKVLDFGLAKLIAAPVDTARTAVSQVSALTDSGKVLGTAQYMSPEQARGLEVDARTDIFSLGIVLYEMLAGRSPFAAATKSDTLVAVLEREPAPLIGITAELQRIVSQALAKDRAQRYSHISELRAELKQIRQPLSRSGQASGQPSRQDDYATNALEKVAVSRPRSRRWLALASALALLVVLGMGLYWWTARTKEIDSLAVMPFVNETGDPNTEYLSDGITESLINSLSQLPRLKVKSRGSVFRYKGQSADPQAVGRELGVRAVLTGRVVQRGDNLAISVELVDVADSNQLWGERYDRSLTDILQTQQDIAAQITDKLRLKLTGAEQKLLAKRPTADPEAYRFYLKGRWHANRLTRADLEKGMQYFQQAVARDPQYALAHQGLAYYYLQSLDLILSPRAAMPKLREMSAQALSLDDTLAEAHFTMAMFHWQYEWNQPAAEKEYQRALEINPNYADALGAYGFFLMMMKRTEEGVAKGKQYLELIALTGEPDFYYAPGLFFARRYDEAIATANAALAQDPNFWLMHVTVGRVYEHTGRLNEAIAAYEKARDIDSSIPEILGDLGRAYARAGRRAEAEKILRELAERAQRSYVAPYNVATIYLGLNDKDRAFTWLEKAYQDRSWYLTWLKAAPIFDTLRADPRFADLQRRVGWTP